MAGVAVVSDTAILDTSWLLELYRVPGYFQASRSRFQNAGRHKGVPYATPFASMATDYLSYARLPGAYGLPGPDTARLRHRR